MLVAGAAGPAAAPAVVAIKEPKTPAPLRYLGGRTSPMSLLTSGKEKRFEVGERLDGESWDKEASRSIEALRLTDLERLR